MCPAQPQSIVVVWCRYDDGKLLSRVVTRPLPDDVMHYSLGWPAVCSVLLSFVFFRFQFWVIRTPVSQTNIQGKPPCARCGHSCTMVGTMLVVFGGTSVDAAGRVVELSDVHILDTAASATAGAGGGAMAWFQPQTTGQAPALTGHAAVAVG